MSNKKDSESTPVGSPQNRVETSGENHNSDQAHRLSHLLHLANDLCLAYRAAIRRVSDVKLRDELVDMDRSHDRLRAQLEDLLVELGQSPVQRGDLHGLVERGRVVIRGLQGDEGILQAMADNERDMVSALREERHQPRVPERIVKVLEEALQNEERHRHYYDQALQVFVG